MTDNPQGNPLKFSCPSCGQHLSCDASYAGMQITCPSCQKAIAVPAGAPPPVALPAAVRLNRPPPVPAAQPAPAPAPASSQTCGLAVASLICSCAGLLLAFLGTIPGIICGHIAMKRIRQNPHLQGKGMVLGGLIAGYVLSLVWAVPIAFILVAAFAGGYRAASRVKQAQQTARQDLKLAGDYDPDKLDATPDGSGWTLDLDNATVPDAPVRGRVEGLAFKPKQVEFQESFGILEFRYLPGPGEPASDMTLDVTFNEHDAAQYSGRTFMVQKDDSVSIQPQGDWQAAKPDIRVYWTDPGSRPSRSHDTMGTPFKYAMRLQFGELKKNQLPGRIYLCVLDSKKSFIRGSFVANVAANPGASAPQPPFGLQRPGQSKPLDTKPDAAGWTLDLENATIPDSAAAGRLHSIVFKPQWVRLDMGGQLDFGQGGTEVFPNSRYKLDLMALCQGQPEKLEGQTITVSSDQTGHDKPHLITEWRDPRTGFPGSLWPEQYAMRLEFGELKDGKIPGRIYLCVLDREKSFIRGKFEARVGQFPSSLGPGRQPVRPARPVTPPGGRPAVPRPGNP